LIYSTYLPGAGPDAGTGIAVDNGGYAYVVAPRGFATTVYVYKLSPDGNRLVYTKALGSGYQAYSIDDDWNGNQAVSRNL
jgi:hypothetical protein